MTPMHSAGNITPLRFPSSTWLVNEHSCFLEGPHWNLIGIFFQGLGIDRPYDRGEPAVRYTWTGLSLRNNRLKFKDCRKFTDHVRGIHKTYSNLTKAKPVDVNMQSAVGVANTRISTNDYAQKSPQHGWRMCCDNPTKLDMKCPAYPYKPLENTWHAWLYAATVPMAS